MLDASSINQPMVHRCASQADKSAPTTLPILVVNVHNQRCEQIACETRRDGKFGMGIHGIAFHHGTMKPLAERSRGWLILPLIRGEARGPESAGDPLAVEDGERRHMGM